MAIACDVFGKPQSITRGGGGLSATRSYVYAGEARLFKTIAPETGGTVQDYDGQPAPTLCRRRPAATLAAWRPAQVAIGYDTMD